MALVGLQECLDRAPVLLRSRLEWFDRNRRLEIPWPEPLEPGQFLATHAKGIFKPKGSDYALSVRQTLGGPYSDKEVIERDDGSWLYAYHQEGADPQDRDRLFTNAGLIRCMRDRVPVGVMLQTKVTFPVEYRVLGLALVIDWIDGYFLLEGFSPQRKAHSSPQSAITDALEAETPKVADVTPTNELDASWDARVRSMQEIVRRQGQSVFRTSLLLSLIHI